MSKKLLIVGVDPGTTLGYALLDIEGRLLKLKSSKLYDLNSLISEIVKEGIPLLVGTDRKDLPGFIDKFGTKIGGKIITPDRDMPVGFKQSLTKDFRKDYKNEHERDALAGALYALKTVSSVIAKVDNYVKKNNKERIREDIINIVLRNDIPIGVAAEILEAPEEEEHRIIKKAIDEKKFDEGFLKLYDKLKRQEKEGKLIKGHSEKLENEISRLKEEIDYLNKKIGKIAPDKKAREQLQFKEKRITAMGRELENREERVNGLEKEIEKLHTFIANIKDDIVVKRLASLGTQEYENKEKMLNIKKGDILLVNDLDISSERVINSLKEKIDIIIYKNKSNKKIADNFVLIPAKNLDIKENGNFAIVDRKQLEKEKLKLGMIDKIIEDYRKGRV